ncbi:MAG: hypothetical protein LZF60_50001 [Nitrospira sp.]|nr:MAG: hypothetical protein LZF60_50001 [Nitrospira sp.]
MLDLLPKRYAATLVQHRLVETLTDPVGLGMPDLGAHVIDVLDRDVQFVLMAFPDPAVFRAAVGEQRVSGMSCCSKKGKTRSLRNSAAGTGVFRSSRLAKPTLL